MSKALTLSMDTLEWAASKTGSSLSDFARELYKTESVINSISNGKLTLPQIRKFSERTKVPFGFLFLPTPPNDFTPSSNLVDFRTVRNNEPLSQNFLDIYKDVEHKQSWYRDYLISIDAPQLSFVGKYKDLFETANNIIANDIRKTLNLANINQSISSAEDYLSALTSHCEDAGILVFKNSVVVNSNNRKLSSEEFRGFVISDDYAPAIFINGEDTKYANIFTLAHELAHVWLGESGVSDADTNSNNRHEIKCNAIAAEILVPNDEFLHNWNSINEELRYKVSALNTIFKVSELVIARVALTNNLISRADYINVQTEVNKRWLESKTKQRNSDGGPPFSVMVPIKNSRKVTQTVLNLLKSNQMATREASLLLNVSATKVVSL